MIFPASLTTVLALSDSRLQCKKENINLGFILDFISTVLFPKVGKPDFGKPYFQTCKEKRSWFENSASLRNQGY